MFLVSNDPLCKLVNLVDSKKAFCWSAYDCSEEEPRIEQMAARFQSEENAYKFKTAFEAAKEFNIKAKVDVSDSELDWATEIEDQDEEKEDEIEINKEVNEI